tara:strand:- start:5173 stop:6381 length:1209 start_codon:yes stop_codon:yes gene_type:complete
MKCFVTLDDKEECVGVFSNGELSFSHIPAGLTHTWEYSRSLLSADVNDAELAIIYANGATLTDVCPPHLQKEWSAIMKRMKAYQNSFIEAKVDLGENCIFDLIPLSYLTKFCHLKTEITKHVFKTADKPENYDFMKGLVHLLAEISQRKIKLNLDSIERNILTKRARDFCADIRSGKKDSFVRYDPFKTRTGRLSVKKGSFPILNLDKEFRCAVEPTNDWIMELDYNAAELRTLLALAGKEQPTEDIHKWNSDILSVSRDEAKKSVISWLYGSKTSDIGEKLSQMYAKEEVLNKFYDPEKGIVTTPFGRKISADDHHALNYLVQSTTADLVFDRMLEIRDLLKDKKSFIKFCLHDSVVIDLAHEERDVIKEVFNIFADTKLGAFKPSISAGTNFGSLKDFNI